MKPHRILLPFSLLYGAVMTIRNAFFEKKIMTRDEVTIPVISIGNMTTGGTGKTPIVELTARLVSDNGVRAAIVSRGYKRHSKGLVVVSDGTRIIADAAQAGDEPHQLAEALPGAIVIVDEQRARGARYAEQELNAGCVILDDGFQHRRLARTLDIVLIDAGQDLFSMPMLPAGHRREPFSSLRRADAFIITKARSHAEIETIERSLRVYAGDAPVFTSTYGPEALIRLATGDRVSQETIRGARVVAFAGIGRPAHFRATVEELGAEIASFHAFPDHHAYTAADCRALEDAQRASGAVSMLTTEKDARRLPRSFMRDVPVHAVAMRARINEQTRFEAFIARAITAGRRP